MSEMCTTGDLATTRPKAEFVERHGLSFYSACVVRGKVIMDRR